MVVEAAATEDPDAPLVAGEKQCRYCRADGCAERARSVFEGIGIMTTNQQLPMFPVLTAPALPSFMLPVNQAPVVQPSADVFQQTANKDAATMTDAELARIMEIEPLMKQLLVNVKEEAMRRFKMGGKIPGFKVVNGKGSRQWAFSDAEMESKLIGMGIPKGAVYETTLVSPAKAEKLTWEKKSKGETVRKQLSDRQLKTMDKEYVVHLGGKPTIVTEDDSREAITLSAAELFKPVEPQPVAQAPQVPELPSWMK
jgi:hypothetical protein